MLGKQPPSSGCELKLADKYGIDITALQPPSSGCELKLTKNTEVEGRHHAAAFERL